MSETNVVSPTTEGSEVERVVMRELDRYESVYSSKAGHKLQREYGETPNGNELNGRWVFRDERGKFIDFDKYRNDLAERNNLDLFNA